MCAQECGSTISLSRPGRGHRPRITTMNHESDNLGNRSKIQSKYLLLACILIVSGLSVSLLTEAKSSTSSTTVEPHQGLGEHTDTHDYEDPDHVDHLQTDIGNGGWGHALEDETDEKLEIRRKIYVKPRKDEFVKGIPTLKPITIEIPIDWNAMVTKDLHLPEDKPAFKMRKYVKEGTKSMIEMVPVKTTIMKPKGMTDDQLITDRPTREQLYHDGTMTL